MIVSTILNLIVVPAMYLVIDDLGVRLAAFGRRFGGHSQLATAGAPASALQLNGATDDREHSVSGRK